ncbi:MAG: peptidase domain-containing ABC transporter [Egibacteraceae bacterium]
MGRRVPFVRQMEDVDCGAACLTMVLHHYGHHAPLSEVRQRCGTTRDGVNAFVLLEVARAYGLEGRARRGLPGEVAGAVTPAIIYWDQSHFVVLDPRPRGGVRILDPGAGRKILSDTEFARHFSGIALTFTPSTSFTRREADPATWRRYVALVLSHRSLFFPILLAALVLLGVGLVVPWLTAYVTDRVILGGRPDLLLIFGLGAASAVCTHGLVMLLRARLVDRLQMTLAMRISHDFMSHLLKLPCVFFENRSGGDLVSRLGNVALIREVLAGGGAAMILDALLIMSYLAAMARYLPRMLIVVVVVALVQVAVVALLIPRVQGLTRKELAAKSETQAYEVEVLRAVSLVKATAVEGPTFARWSALLARQLDASLQRGRSTAVLDSLVATLRMAAPLALLWVGAASVISGEQSLGDLLAFNALAVAFLIPVGSLATQAQQLQLLGAVIERVEDVMRAPAEAAPRDPPPLGTRAGAITVDRVSFTYGPHSPRVLEEVSCLILPGEKVAVVGATGCGKTTLARLLLGLYTPTAGSIRYDGVDLRAMDPAAWRRRIGVVPQEPYLFNDTIANNIAFHRPLEMPDIDWAAQMAVLHADITRMPMGYSSLVGEGGQRLSGGQRQRVAIARALAARPSVLLFDEATSGLDAMTESLLQENLRSLGTTCILIAHRLSTIVNADRILVLDEGRLVEQGRHEDLLLRGGRYAQLWERQTAAKRPGFLFANGTNPFS